MWLLIKTLQIVKGAKVKLSKWRTMFSIIFVIWYVIRWLFMNNRPIQRNETLHSLTSGQSFILPATLFITEVQFIGHFSCSAKLNLLPVVLILIFCFCFVLQRTVFPKDYYVEHHYTKSMLCDTDPVSSLPNKKLTWGLMCNKFPVLKQDLNFSYCWNLVNAWLKEELLCHLSSL